MGQVSGKQDEKWCCDGSGRWLFRNPSSGKPKPTDTSLLGHYVKPPKHGQVGKCKIQAVVRNKRNQMRTFNGFDDQSDTYHDT
jgi:hypothetical protein